MDLESKLRVVPDFPKPGIEFLDISPLLEDPQNFKTMMEQLANKAKDLQITKIVGIEARGFILGSALALHMGKGFVMVRKKGKLPGDTVSISYDLEYGTDTIEMLPHSIKPGEKVLILDDVLATGGTAAAACELVKKMGGEIQGCLFLVELAFLGGRSRLDYKTDTIITRN